MSVESIRKIHEYDVGLHPEDFLQSDVLRICHSHRGELLRVIDALLNIYIDLEPYAGFIVGETEEAKAILRGEKDDE